jgi:hypothetical protein
MPKQPNRRIRGGEHHAHPEIPDLGKQLLKRRDQSLVGIALALSFPAKPISHERFVR